VPSRRFRIKRRFEIDRHNGSLASGEHEVDLIVERDDGRILAIDVKLSTTVDDRDVRHLKWLSERLGSKRYERPH
jgi:hypothetical protein